MRKGTRISVAEALAKLQFLPDRTPQMAFSGGSDRAFAEVSPYRDGAIYIGFYSGNSEWERHVNGDEIVMVLEGSTTVVMRQDGQDIRSQLRAHELIVVPADTWHRFEASERLKVMTVTPQPTDHRLQVDDA